MNVCCSKRMPEKELIILLVITHLPILNLKYSYGTYIHNFEVRERSASFRYSLSLVTFIFPYSQPSYDLTLRWLIPC